MFEKEIISCGDVETFLGDYVDEELTGSLQARLGEHIRGCTRCQESEAGYRRVIELARLMREEQTSKPLRSDIQNRLREGLNKRLGLNLPEVK